MNYSSKSLLNMDNKSVAVIILVTCLFLSANGFGQEKKSTSDSTYSNETKNALSILVNQSFNLNYKRLYAEPFYLGISIILDRDYDYETGIRFIGDQKYRSSLIREIVRRGIRLQLIYDLYTMNNLKINTGAGPIIFYELIHNTESFSPYFKSIEYDSKKWSWGISLTTSAEVRAHKQIFLTAGYEIIFNHSKETGEFYSNQGWEIELGEIMLGAIWYF